MPRNHSYFIAITLPEPLHSQIEAVKKYISETFHTRSVLKSPAHITIIPPFFWGNETALKECIAAFECLPFDVQLTNYGAFPPSVVYIDVVQNKALMDLYHRFNQHFYTYFPSLDKRHPYPFHPHITIGNRDWKKEDFTRCWNEMKDKQYNQEFTCAQVTLLKLVEGKWFIV